MFQRTTERTVTFQRPFSLRGVGKTLPPGQYLIETDETLLDGTSMPVYRRTATSIRLMDATGGQQLVPVDPDELEAALFADAGQSGAESKER